MTCGRKIGPDYAGNCCDMQRPLYDSTRWHGAASSCCSTSSSVVCSSESHQYKNAASRTTIAQLR